MTRVPLYLPCRKPDSDWPKYNSEDQKLWILHSDYVVDQTNAERSKMYIDDCHFWSVVVPALEKGRCE